MKTKTDPCGELEYCIGSQDDFHCFDYCLHDDGTMTLHSVINSETGGFIMDGQKPVRVPISEAVELAKDMMYQALDWCIDNKVKHDQKGWNQSPCYFWRSVHVALAAPGDYVPRIPVTMVKRPLITSNYTRDNNK